MIFSYLSIFPIAFIAFIELAPLCMSSPSREFSFSRQTSGGSQVASLGSSGNSGPHLNSQSDAQGGSDPNASAASCPVVPIVKNFQADKYLGRWYEIQRFPTPFQTGQCVTADYSLLPNCSIGVINSNILRDGSLDSIQGLAHSAGDPTRGSLTVVFPNDPRSSSSNREGNYNVLATDYSNYAVVYSCSIVDFGRGDTKLELSWILSRRPHLNDVFLDRLSEWLKRLGIAPAKYEVTNHKGCQYAPA